MTVEKVKVVNIWADKDGVSHFRDVEIDLSEIPQGGALSAPIQTNTLWFRTTPKGQDMDWHPAPRRQFVVALSGGVAELTASDGEVRCIKPGEIVLVEDTFGKGHRSKAFDGLPRLSLFIGLTE